MNAAVRQNVETLCETGDKWTPGVFRKRNRTLGDRTGACVSAMLFIVCLSCDHRFDYNALTPDALNEPAKTPQAYPVVIHLKDGVGSLAAGQVDALGRPIGVACDVCHDPDFENSIVSAKNSVRDGNTPFHQQVHDIRFMHGNLTCGQCHNPARQSQSAVHLADREPVEYPAVIYLCGQCHGTQFRDYSNGIHGGAGGYWNRQKGAQYRNHCVDCHDPHAPTYPTVTPVGPPRDRYQSAASAQLMQQPKELNHDGR